MMLSTYQKVNSSIVSKGAMNSFKKTLSRILLHVFCLDFLRIQHNCFFRRGFENVRAQFLSGNISKKECITYKLPVQLRFIEVN